MFGILSASQVKRYRRNTAGKSITLVQQEKWDSYFPLGPSVLDSTFETAEDIYERYERNCKLDRHLMRLPFLDDVKQALEDLAQEGLLAVKVGG